MRCSYTLIIAFLLLSAIGPANASAQRTDNEIMSLCGVPGVFVILEALQPDVVAAGLSAERIHTSVEAQLRDAGIAVLTEQEFYKQPGRPHLYIFVNTVLEPQTGLYALNILVQFRQAVRLIRDGDIASDSASTWETGTTGMVGTPRIATYPLDAIGEFIDEFIGDYYSVNPRRG